ncbi:MAG TPA: hypothetical protein PLN69_10540 [bacterium]|nr:hypothetical protein [bacterium]
MVFETNPITDVILKYHRKKILKEFPCVGSINHGCYISLWKYIENIPERFYSRRASDEILGFLNDLLENDSCLLCDLLARYENLINLAFKALGEINALPIHDEATPQNEYELMQYFDSHVHPCYLKLVESVYANLIVTVSAYQRMVRKAQLDGFDVYNRVEELKNTSYEYLTEQYNHTVRNAIAHGKVVYKVRDIIYEDKNNTDVFSSSTMISLLDNMLDICNGLALGICLFYFTHKSDLENLHISIPNEIMIEELKHQTNAPGWVIKGCLDSQTIENKHQLNIFTENEYLDALKLHYQVYRTAILAEKYSPGYDRYFISLVSKYSLPGWAGFDGRELNKQRLSEECEEKDYSKVLENNLIFFIPRIKLPRIVFKISNLITAFKSIVPVSIMEALEKTKTISILPRHSDLHRNGLYVVIHSRIIVETNGNVLLNDLIRSHVKLIFKKTIKAARSELASTNFNKMLRVGYASIGVYSQDFRKRKLRNSGLIPELICTIEYKRLKTIKTVDIFGGSPEVIGGFRIVWNTKPTQQ